MVKRDLISINEGQHLGFEIKEKQIINDYYLLSVDICLSVCLFDAVRLILMIVYLPPFVHPFFLFEGGTGLGGLGGGLGKVFLGRGRF